MNGCRDVTRTFEGSRGGNLVERANIVERERERERESERERERGRE